MFLIMGIATAFNILVIFRKIEVGRHQDVFFDASLLILLTLVFGGSLGGMLVATVASAIISIYFLFNPPNLFDFGGESEDINIDTELDNFYSNLAKKYNLNKE